MADMTDSAFCQTAREASGPDFVIFREMISAQAIVRNSEKTKEMCRLIHSERPLIQQIFGSYPQVMAEATKIIDDLVSPDGFDINMGCPARKIVGNFNGSALMKEPETAAAIVRTMKAATDKPVSVKTRLGWSDPTEILKFSKVIEGAGADAIIIHGRTKEQGYAGQANWEMIGRVKSQLSIPVILNGDVTDGPSAKRALEQTRCDGLMIGRGALGNPWIFAEISHYLEGKQYDPPSRQQAIELMLQHAERHAAAYPKNDRPLISLRAHLVHYFKGEPGAKEWRLAAVRVSTMDDLRQITEQLLA